MAAATEMLRMTPKAQRRRWFRQQTTSACGLALRKEREEGGPPVADE